MKKLLIFIVGILILAFSAYGAGLQVNNNNNVNDNMQINNQNNTHEQDVGIQNTAATQNQEQIMDQTRHQEKAQTMDQLKEQIQLKKQDMEKETAEMNTKEQKIYQNQNQVREAVHALQQMEGLIGGIGPQVSEVAKHFENSVQNTIKAEEKIQSRSKIARFFAGGDKEAAENIEKEVNQNMQKLQELKQLKNQCTDCDEAAKEMLQEQIQNMEIEQSRMMELAQKEKKSKGLFGWIWK